MFVALFISYMAAFPLKAMSTNRSQSNIKSVLWLAGHWLWRPLLYWYFFFTPCLTLNFSLSFCQHLWIEWVWAFWNRKKASTDERNVWEKCSSPASSPISCSQTLRNSASTQAYSWWCYCHRFFGPPLCYWLQYVAHGSQINKNSSESNDKSVEWCM